MRPPPSLLGLSQLRLAKSSPTIETSGIPGGPGGSEMNRYGMVNRIITMIVNQDRKQYTKPKLKLKLQRIRKKKA